MVHFDRRWPISDGINRGRKKREKERENLEIRRCSIDPDPSPIGFLVLRGENLQRSWGEENDARASHRGFAGIFLFPARASQGEDVSSPCVGRRNDTTMPEHIAPYTRYAGKLIRT
ncbi:hypothetical protein GW17_00056283 [Ensete ventricosum]|nr:hypothetical protein GW17_00056283 [Ensete ventricosum]